MNCVKCGSTLNTGKKYCSYRCANSISKGTQSIGARLNRVFLTYDRDKRALALGEFRGRYDPKDFAIHKIKLMFEENHDR